MSLLIKTCGLQLYLKKIPAQVFSMNFIKFLGTAFFTKHLRTTTSASNCCKKSGVYFSDQISTLRARTNIKDLPNVSCNPVTTGIHKMVKHTLKIMLHLIKNFKRVSDHFANTR